MNDAFNDELVSFEVIPLAEQGAEGIHRDVAGELQRAHGTKLYGVAAHSRSL